MSPLSAAASGGHLATVTTLLEARAAVGTYDVNGRTAISLAAQRGHTDVLAALLGRVVGAPDCRNRTALWHAVRNGHAAAAQLLLAAKADVRTAPAAEHGHVELLVQASTQDNTAAAADCVFIRADAQEGRVSDTEDEGHASNKRKRMQ
jgi:ankyrin repeat protein